VYLLTPCSLYPLIMHHFLQVRLFDAKMNVLDLSFLASNGLPLEFATGMVEKFVISPLESSWPYMPFLT